MLLVRNAKDGVKEPCFLCKVDTNKIHRETDKFLCEECSLSATLSDITGLSYPVQIPKNEIPKKMRFRRKNDLQETIMSIYIFGSILLAFIALPFVDEDVKVGLFLMNKLRNTVTSSFFSFITFFLSIIVINGIFIAPSILVFHSNRKELQDKKNLQDRKDLQDRSNWSEPEYLFAISSKVSYDRPGIHWGLRLHEKYIKTLGEELNSKGGIEMMRDVCNDLRSLKGAGPARELEHIWGGIGNWRA